ncbi:putative membrane protein [Candidatus Phytoplasma solani]|uniref:hypothetical protein n=1 Tax=Candidatus Phytoplasma solani TaxID=69896 RepID=UPI0032DAC68A
MNCLKNKRTIIISFVAIILIIIIFIGGGICALMWHKLSKKHTSTIKLSVPTELLKIVKTDQTQGNLIPTNQTKMPNDVDQIEVKTTLKSFDNASVLLELKNPVLTLTEETKTKLNNEETTQIETLLTSALTTKHTWFDGVKTQIYNNHNNNKPTLKGEMQISTLISLDNKVLEQKENENAFNLLKEKAPSISFCIEIFYDGTQQ